MEPVFTAGFWLGSGLSFVTEVGDVALGRPFVTDVSGIAAFEDSCALFSTEFYRSWLS